ncbi:MAG: ion transporter [Gammaproteobacteria bacterium]
MSTAHLSREHLGQWIESTTVQRFVVALIIINAVTLGLETSRVAMDTAGGLLKFIDRTLLFVFAAEIAVKLYAFGPRFFRNPWNVFDFLVVGIALVPSSGPLTVLRVLRLLRLISLVPRFRFVVESLLRAIPGIMSIAGLLVILFYVAAVMATGLFGGRFPEWFGTIGDSMYTLFQVMTLESWSMGIARPVMDVFPWAWMFFIPFILIATFTMLNLFIAIIVSTMQSMVDEQSSKETGAISEVVHGDNALLLERLDTLHDEMRALRAQIAEHGSKPSD